MRDGSAVAGGARVGVSPGALTRLRSGALAVDLAVVGSVALVLGLLRLGTPSLWIDESFTARAMDIPIADYRDQYHALYYLLMRPWTGVAGTSEWALRLPSVLGLMLSCALLVVLGRRLFGRRVALVAGLLLAVSPFLVQWSQQARGYTLVVAVSVLATLLLLRAVDSGTRWAWALYGLALSAVVVWHPASGVLLVPAHLLLVAGRRERVLPHGLLAAVIVAVAAVPWAAIVAMRSTGEGVAMNWLKFPSAETATRALLDVSGAGGVGLVLAVAGLWLLRRSSRSQHAMWLGAWAFAPFAVALVISLGRPIYLDRYLLVAAPAFALLGALALTRLGRRPRPVALAAAVVGTVVGLALWYTASDDGGNWRGEDWRSAVATVLERRDEADAIVVAPWSTRAAAEYYGARVVDSSTTDSIWVLTWSETGEALAAADRRGLGFGEHRLVERLEFGWRVRAELWRAQAD